jgi:hypothetical protein
VLGLYIMLFVCFIVFPFSLPLAGQGRRRVVDGIGAGVTA